MVPADSDRISPVPSYSGDPASAPRLRLQAFHLLWGGFPVRFVFAWFASAGPATPRVRQLANTRFGLAPVRSPLPGGSLNCFLFLKVLRWFNSVRYPCPV